MTYQFKPIILTKGKGITSAIKIFEKYKICTICGNIWGTILKENL